MASQVIPQLRLTTAELFPEGNEISLLDPADNPAGVSEDLGCQPMAQFRSQAENLMMTLAQPRIQVVARGMSDDQPKALGQFRGEHQVIGMTRIPSASQGETDGDFARVLLTLGAEYREARLARFQLEVARGVVDMSLVARGAIGGPATPTGDSQE
jgi:hypothetical protein